jgi:hypothetical protein
MDKKLRNIEDRLLMYFNMVANGCKDYIKCCAYTPYYCGYSKPSENAVNSYELCLFIAGKIKCPGEIEKHYVEKHNKSTYRTTLRAIESLERKGYIEKVKISGHLHDLNSKWYCTYKLVEP